MHVDPGAWSLRFLAFVDAGELRLPFHPETGAPLSLHDRRFDDHAARPAEWRRAEGRGVVRSFVVFHRRYAANADAPAILATIELTEGHRLVTPLVDIASADVSVGLAVTIANIRPKGPVTFRATHPPA